MQCADVCTALAAETCNGDRRLPAGFPEVESCLQGCEFVAQERQILQCGEAYVVDPEQCDEASFAWCLIELEVLNVRDCAIVEANVKNKSTESTAPLSVSKKNTTQLRTIWHRIRSQLAESANVSIAS